MNQELEFLQNIFQSEGQSIDLLIFLFQLLLTALLCLLIGFMYTKYGNALSNRRALAKTFVLVGISTMLIITIVKSSLALSLGLVGALSIVRFRTAIKEPEELAFFFMIIGVGLGVGAGQFLVTVVGTIGLCLSVFLINRKKSKELSQNLIIQVEGMQGEIDIPLIVKTLEDHCSQLELRRLDEKNSFLEIGFAANFKDYTALLGAKKELKKVHADLSFSFLELL